MRGLRREAGPFELSRRRQLASHREGLVRLILYRGPTLLVAGVHAAPKQACVYLRYQAVVVRPLVYPIRVTLGSLDLPIDRNLHSSDQLPHVNLHFRLSASTIAVSATPPAGHNIVSDRLHRSGIASAQEDPAASTGAALRPPRKTLPPSDRRSSLGCAYGVGVAGRATSVGQMAAMRHLVQ